MFQRSGRCLRPECSQVRRTVRLQVSIVAISLLAQHTVLHTRSYVQKHYAEMDTGPFSLNQSNQLVRPLLDKYCTNFNEMKTPAQVVMA